MGAVVTLASSPSKRVQSDLPWDTTFGMPPSSIDTELTRARHYFSAGRFDQAIEVVEAETRRNPTDVATLVRCAQSFGFCYEIGRAEAVLEQALELAAPREQSEIALVFQQVFRPDRAVEILERLRSNDALPLPRLAQLAKLYEQSNRRDEATAALRECVQKAPQQPQPRVLLGRLLRQAGDDQAAEQALLSGTAESSPLATRVHAWSELAQLYDDLAQYAKAVETMERAKSLLRMNPQVQEQARRSLAVNEAFTKYYADIHPNMVREWANTSLAAPNAGVRGFAHLLGFPRSGTTLLEQALDAHPKVHAASERAVFSKAIFPTMSCDKDGAMSLQQMCRCSASKLELLRGKYVQFHQAIAGLAPPRRDEYVLLDKNPNHTSHLAGLFRLLPESRFLLALRDPRDVIVSTYMRFFSLSEFSASYITWESTCAMYAHEMRIWLKMRELLAGSWIEIKYEDTVANLADTTRQVLTFLDLDWHDDILRDRDDQKFVHSPTHAEVRKPVYQSSIGRWKNYEPYLRPCLAELEPFIRAFGYE